MPLERAITDFGADLPFGKIVDKMKEHYGIEIPPATARLITEKHAYKIFKMEKKASTQERILISETDGSMIPIVEIDDAKKDTCKDSRKARKVIWKEVKLCFARGKDKIKRYYTGGIGTSEEAGQKMLDSAILAGMTEGTYIHAIGDGAPWIAEQVKLKFCNRSGYLIDFFHLCEYLSGASVWCNVLEPKKWLEESKEKLKTGRQLEVFQEVKMKYEVLENQEQDNGLTKCYKYMEKRLNYFNYQEALLKGLPIGSGEMKVATDTWFRKD